MSNPKYSSIKDNVFSYNTYYGIYVTGQHTPAESLYIVDDSINFVAEPVEDSSQYGIYVNNTTPKYLVHNNKVLNYHQGGIKIAGNGSDGTVSLNNIKDVYYYGIYFDNYCEPTADSNTVDGNTNSVRVAGEAQPDCGDSGTEGRGNNQFLTSSGHKFVNANIAVQTQIKAEDNWWGTDDSTTIHNNYIGGAVDWNPFLGSAPFKSSFVDGSLPAGFTLNQNFPNPFNPSTNIKYSLPFDTHVKVAIFNLLGQRIRTLVDDYKTAGHWTLKWDGKDANGKDVASGIYFYSLETDESHKVKKMSLIK